MDSSPSIDPLLGRVIAGKFELLEVLGSGAMGKVYRAMHLGLAKPVAIKVLAIADHDRHHHSLRFKAEARAASRLDHQNVVQILDFGEDADGLLYLAMEFLDGRDLQALLKEQGRLDTVRVLWIMSQVMSAISAAHRKGVIHRDIKPGNIMLTTKAGEDGMIADFVKVCDFGLAKILDVGDGEASSGPVTRQGAIFGTPAYMSPEQARGEILDHLSDIYSCGVIIYKMVTGRTPFRAETPTGVLMKHISDPFVPMREILEDVDPRLDAIVERAMKKDKHERYRDAREMRDELERIMADAGIARDRTEGSYPLVRATSLVETELPETVTPSMAATTGADVHPMQTLPPANESQATAQLTAPPPKTTMIAAIPGAIALVLVGGMAAFILIDQRSEAPPPSATVARRIDPDPPPIEPPPPIAPPVAPPIAPAIEPPAIHTKQRKRRARPTVRAPSPPPPSAPAIEPPAIEPQKPIVQIDPPPANVVPPPVGPAKLEAGWRLSIAIEDVKVDGGISKMRSKDELERRLAGAKSCLQQQLARDGVHATGRIRMRATIDVRGHLEDLEASGLRAAEPCLVAAFASARLPRPDTGTGSIAFVLSYETKR